jgi:hypothetical protein
MKLEDPKRNTGRLAATRRFPDQADLIEELIDRNEDFSEMCEELADAERALLAVDSVPAEVRAARRAEWQGWIARLTKEIDCALCNGSVIRLTRFPRH